MGKQLLDGATGWNLQRQQLTKCHIVIYPPANFGLHYMGKATRTGQSVDSQLHASPIKMDMCMKSSFHLFMVID